MSNILSRRGVSLIQVVVAAGVMITVVMLSARHFQMMSWMQTKSTEGQDTIVLQEDVRKIINDSMECKNRLSVVKMATAQSGLNFPYEMRLRLAGDEILGGDKPLQRYRVGEVKFEAQEAQRFFVGEQNEEVWKLDTNLVMVRSNGEAVRPRPTGSLAIKIGGDGQLIECHQSPMALMGCGEKKQIQYRDQLKEYRCINVQEEDQHSLGSRFETAPVQPQINQPIDPNEWIKNASPEELKRAMEMTEGLRQQMGQMCQQMGGKWDGLKCTPR